MALKVECDGCGALETAPSGMPDDWKKITIGERFDGGHEACPNCVAKVRAILGIPVPSNEPLSFLTGRDLEGPC